MKPTKNNIFCYGCRRTKMLFETQAKADNFIKFNQDEILEDHGKAPVRSYFCSFCNGYHVTSNPSTEIGEQLNVKDEEILNDVLDRYSHRKIRKNQISEICNKTDKNKASALKVPIWNKLEKAISLLKVGKISEFKTTINECSQNIEEARSIWPNGYLNKLKDLEQHVTDAYILLSDLEFLLNKDDKEQAEYILNLGAEKKRLITHALHNYNVINNIHRLLTNNDNLISNKKFDEAERGLEHINDLINEISTTAFNKMYPDISASYLRQREKIEFAKHHPFEYKDTLLSLIERIDSIKKALMIEDYHKCQNLIDAGYAILDDLGIEDDNTKLIRSQLDLLAQQL